jgi:hypothetical protein
MGEYANAFFQGFNAVRDERVRRSEAENAAAIYERLADTTKVLGEVTSTAALRRKRTAAVGEAAALPIGSDTPVAAIPALTGAALPAAPAPESAPAAALPVAPAATAAPAAALPAAPVAQAPAGAGTASPVDPNAPIVGAASDDLELLKPAALNFAEVSGMLANGGFTPEQSFALIQKFNETGNALASQYLGLAATRFGSAEGGNALAALMETNDPDGNYRATFQDGKYVVVDLTSENPQAESHVFDQTQVEQLLAQATEGKSPILAYNKGINEMAINASRAKTAESAAVTAAEQAKNAGRAIDARIEIAGAAEKGRMERAGMAADMAREKMAALAANQRNKDAAKKAGLDVDSFVAREVYYKTHPAASFLTRELFGSATSTLMRGGLPADEAVEVLARDEFKKGFDYLVARGRTPSQAAQATARFILNNPQ